ncbi:MAG: HhH-GPD [Hyphomicrobiales bacterium]|nr:HhH-GPD [Hyphomicrobiales bacterium]
MAGRLATQADLDAAIEELVRMDPRLGAVRAATGVPLLRRHEPGFPGLARIVCGQQLSVASAAAIWARLVSEFGELDHHHFRDAESTRLGGLGLSAGKIRTLKGAAQAVVEGRLDLAALASAEVEDAHRILTALHGVGPWTADIYLLFCLGRGDAWPAGDLALQEAVRIGLGLPDRPGNKSMIEIAGIWRPLRGAAAHLWWAYYHVLKS